MTDMPDLATLAAHFRGETTVAQDTQILAWRERSDENEAVFRAYLTVWTEAEPADEVPAFDVKAGWRELSEKLALDVSTVGHDAVTRPLPKRRWTPFWIPGMVAAALVSALLLWLWVGRTSSGALTVIATNPGEVREIVLVDGSKVWLDGQSRLTHANSFGEKQRVLKLEGHAYFEVRASHIPFEVTTDSAKVRVLGTQFDVWAGNGKTKVSVREGRVALHSLKQSRRVELGPNQMAECLMDGRLTASVILENPGDFSWMVGTRVFVKKPLADVIVDLERIFGKPIELSNPAMGTRTITATFRDETLEQILADICLALNLDYIERNDSYLLTPKGD